MAVSKLIGSMMSMGFSEYESRAYIALLGHNPVTAYMVARASGIATSKVYETLDKLVERGVVLAVGEGRARKFVPLGPTEFMDRLRGRTDDALGSIETGLLELHSVSEPSVIWNLAAYEPMISKALRMIGAAKDNILISVWADEMGELAPALREAESRGTRVSVVHFGIAGERAGQMFTHPIHDTIYAERGGRGIALVSDIREALIGTIRPDGECEGAYSANRGFVTLAEDYIKHDVYIMKVVHRFDRELRRAFGDSYELLRDVFTDRERTHEDLD